MTTTLSTGLTADNKHLKLMAVTAPIEITRGQLIETSFYVVAVIDFSFTHQYFTKDVDQFHQYDTQVKAQRKFDRLNVISK